MIRESAEAPNGTVDPHNRTRSNAIGTHVARPELAQARQLGFHGIGEASAATGVSARMIRRYEAAGLTPTPGRTFAGYRLYAQSDLDRLRFIRRSRTLGFSMKQVGMLLELWSDASRPTAHVKQMALAHATALRGQIARMQAMQRTLESLAGRCQGNRESGCPILDDLAGIRASLPA